MPVLTPAPPRGPQFHIETANANIGPEALLHEPPTQPYGLFPFQDRAAKHLIAATSGVLISRAGVGKSTVAAAVGAEALRSTEVERVVIIAPPYATHEWARIITHVTAHDDIIAGTTGAGERWRTYATNPSRWMVVPYSVVATDVEVMLPLMATSMIIIDQAHNVKNPAAARSGATLRLNEAAARRLMLLGPAWQNGYDEWDFLISAALDPTGTRRQVTRDIPARAGMNIGNTSMLTLSL